MPTFAYSARDLKGEAVRGSLDAASRKIALQKLSARKLRPLSVKEESEAEKQAGGRKLSLPFLARDRSQATVANLNRSVALPFLQGLRELLNCGIQAGDALRMMSTRLSDPRQKLLATRLWEELRQGKSLSESFQKHSRVFPESIVSLVEAGEATGSLNHVLVRIVESMEERKAIKAKLTAALAYPLFLITISIGLVLLFLFNLLPKIQGLLSSLGGKLPASTRVLIGLSEAMIAYGWIVAIGLALVATLLVSWRKSPAGRPKFDAFVLKVPGVGRFVRDTQILQLTQTLALLLENGITMVQSLQMAERSLSNQAMRVRFAEARSKVTEGVALSTAFKATGYFEDMALDIFTVGENTGDVVPGLKQMSRQYADLIDRFVKRLMGVVSVGVLMGVFVMVGLIAFGIISAVFQLSSSLSAG